MLKSFLEKLDMLKKTCAPETRRKISDAKKGRRCGDENPMFGIHRYGKDSPHWKGGITPVMQGVRHSYVYKNWRKAVFERDDYTCQMCKARGGKLEAHHIRPVRDHKNDLLIFDINNGITLCKDCHKSIKGKEHDFIDEFDTIIV